MKRMVGVLAVIVAVASVHAQRVGLVADVRAAIDANDFARAEALIATSRAAGGMSPEVLEAMSWLGRGALAARQWDRAEDYAQRTYDAAVGTLKTRGVDQEPRLPIALGAAIEVLAQAAAEKGQRSEAIQFLDGELKRYAGTSIQKRIQKNINLLSLEGTVAPELDVSESAGPRPPRLSELRGRVALLFFWAHWCADCKAQAPVLARVAARYGPQGLVLLAPTQRYGYVAGGKAAAAADENAYIPEVWRTSYAALGDVPVLLADRNHRRYGVSTTPTLVLVDQRGVVRLYHPGKMTEEELEPIVRQVMTAD